MINILKRKWEFYSNLGSEDCINKVEKRQVQIANRLNLILFLNIGFFQLINLLNGIYKNYEFTIIAVPFETAGLSVNLILILAVTAFNIYLNYKRQFILSKASITFIPLYLILIYPLQLFESTNEFYFWYPVVPIPFVLLPVLLFDWQKNKVLYILSVAYPLLLIFFTNEILNYCAPPNLSVVPIVAENILWYKAIPTSVGLFLFLAVNYLIKQLNSSVLVYSNQNRELNKTIDELNRTQGQLIVTEKMATVGRMSAELTHEMNTPIGAIKGNLSMMRKDQRNIYQLWEEIGRNITGEEFTVLIKLIKEVIGNENPDYGFQNKTDNKIVSQLRSAGVDQERIQTIAEYFTDFNVKDIRPYLSLCLHDEYARFLEIVYCENNVNHSTVVCKDAIGKAERLITKLKTYSFKRGWEREKEYDINKLIINSLELNESKLIDVNVRYVKSTEVPLLTGLPDEIIQVINNLITNAAHATEYKGIIDIKVIYQDQVVLLSVEDNGGGVQTLGDQDIFEPFFTTKDETEGTGLGLNICKQIVEKHRGSIYWQNTEKGARFTVELPV
ncbi:MAG: GHKL domain-containing protein [Cyclobacteriaceae bacterium]